MNRTPKNGHCKKAPPVVEFLKTTTGGIFMPCKKGTKQMPQAVIDEILGEYKRGTTTKELANKYGKPFWTIKNMIRREREKGIRIVAGISLNRKGRPPKDCIDTDEDKISDLRYKISRKDYQIKQLEMQNELLRDFLKEIERG